MVDFKNISHINRKSVKNQVQSKLAPSPITSWQIDGEKVETVTDFIFLSSKITTVVTADIKLKDTCSLEEKL